MKKVLISSFLILLVILPIGLGSTFEDWSEGQFLQNSTGNDAPYFISWYETSELITPLVDVILNATVFDIDNSTTEINITVYYTFHTFAYENLSVELVYDSNPSLHIYYYEYQFFGQEDVTTMRYYYQAYDGENIIREGYPTYFEITWSYPPVTFERTLPADVDYEFPFEFTLDHAVILFLSLFILSVTILFFMEKSKNYTRTK